MVRVDPLSPAWVVDNGDYGRYAVAATTGSVQHAVSYDHGWLNDVDYIPSGVAATATWTFSNLPAGRYLVSSAYIVGNLNARDCAVPGERRSWWSRTRAWRTWISGTAMWAGGG